MMEYAEANESKQLVYGVMYEGEPYFYISDRPRFPANLKVAFASMTKNYLTTLVRYGSWANEKFPFGRWRRYALGRGAVLSPLHTGGETIWI